MMRTATLDYSDAAKIISCQIRWISAAQKAILHEGEHLKSHC
jgi:hypothetical protein